MKLKRWKEIKSILRGGGYYHAVIHECLDEIDRLQLERRDMWEVGFIEAIENGTARLRGKKIGYIDLPVELQAELTKERERVKQVSETVRLLQGIATPVPPIHKCKIGYGEYVPSGLLQVALPLWEVLLAQTGNAVASDKCQASVGTKIPTEPYYIPYTECNEE